VGNPWEKRGIQKTYIKEKNRKGKGLEKTDNTEFYWENLKVPRQEKKRNQKKTW